MLRVAARTRVQILRAVPLYVDGVLYAHAGSRRTVVAIDAGTGEALWIFREPNTPRWQRSGRSNWGKGVAYAEVDGRGVVYMTSPAYFLHHPLLDGVPLPNTGQHTHAHPLVTKSLFTYGEGRGGTARLHAVEKLTGEPISTVELPASTSMVPITFMHEGRQHIAVAVADRDHPGSLVALRLP